MHQRVHEEWLRIFDEFPPPGPVVVELGAPGRPEGSLLTPLHRRNPDGRYIGVNLGFSSDPIPGRPYELLASNANDLSVLADGSVDAVVTNAMLEHDEAFWLTLSEVRRILRPGGYFYVGVPGYSKHLSPPQKFLARLGNSRFGRNKTLGPIIRRVRHDVFGGTPTMVFHAAPDDFYRFSEQAVRRVFLKDMDCKTMVSILRPVRHLAVGQLRDAS